MQWYEAMRLMPELGATCAVQMPPGHALAALVAGSAPSMYALALEDDGIERAVDRRGDLVAPTPALAQSRSPISPPRNG